MTHPAVAPVTPFPDAELVAIAWLRARGFNAAAAMGPNPARPNLVVTRIGGSPAVKWAVDAARLQIDTYAATKTQARQVAAEALAAMYELPGQGGAAQGAFVSDVDVNLGLSWQPDTQENPPVPRYLFEVAVTLRPSD